jgi:adenylate cyclase
MSSGDDPALLTPRQREIVGLLSTGLTNHEISAALGISENTVRVHVAAILSALGAANRTEAAFLYRQHAGASLTGAAIHRPAIAVLPFVDLGPGTDHDHIADGLTEDLIARLFAWRWFVMISHASSRRYADADLDRIRHELGAAYAVTATVRRAADRLRVNVHLSDTASAAALHASSVDAPMREVFATQDEVCRRIMARLAPELMQAAGAAAAQSIESDPAATEATDAWRHAVRGMWYLNRYTADDVAQARDAFDAAVRVDPRCHFAWYGRCLVYQHLLWEQLSDDPARDLEALRTAAAQCVRIAPDAWQSRTAAGLAAMLSGDRDAAEHHLRAALAANPSSSQALSLLAQCHGLAGRFAECAGVLEDALRLNPWSASRWLHQSSLGVMHYLAGDHAAAIARLEDALRERPEAPSVLVVLAAVHAECGALEAASAVAERLRAAGPFDLERHIASIGAVAAPQFIERFRAALRRIGLDA